MLKAVTVGVFAIGIRLPSELHETPFCYNLVLLHQRLQILRKPRLLLVFSLHTLNITDP